MDIGKYKDIMRKVSEKPEELHSVVVSGIMSLMPFLLVPFWDLISKKI